LYKASFSNRLDGAYQGTKLESEPRTELRTTVATTTTPPPFNEIVYRILDAAPAEPRCFDPAATTVAESIATAVECTPC
jgi:hypothetical protein